MRWKATRRAALPPARSCCPRLACFRCVPVLRPQRRPSYAELFVNAAECAQLAPCCADGFPVLEGKAEEIKGKHFEIRKVRCLLD